MALKSRYRRGYPVAVLIGFAQKEGALWRIYSKVVKPETTIRLNGNRNNIKDTYNFNELIVNALRPILKEGIRSIILASPPRTAYTQDFREHVKRHHTWLTQGTNKVTFAEITGSAITISDVSALTKNPLFKELIQNAAFEETEDLLDLLEANLNDTSGNKSVLYSLEDIEDSILYSKAIKVKPEFLLLTNKYLTHVRQKSRVQKLMQIAINKNIKARVVDADSPAGKRLTQLGGIVCLTKIV
ncbi:MAG: hypothetical protein ACM3WQ_04260 [Chloroflexota bacterium]